MAEPLEIGSLLTLCVPMFGALFAFLLLLMDSMDCLPKVHRENHVLMVYFLLVILNLGQVLSLHFDPEVYVWTSALGLLSYGLLQIFFYWFVFELTRMQVDEKFSALHFIAPLVFSGVLLGLVASYGTLEQLVHRMNDRSVIETRSLVWVFMGNVYGLKLVFGVVYLFFNCFRLIRYNRFIRNYSANEEKSSLRWLWLLLAVSVAAMPFPLIWIYMKSTATLSLIAIISYSLLMLFIYVYLTYHVLRKDRFRVVFSASADSYVSSDSYVTSDSYVSSDSLVSKKSVLTKVLFEDFMVREKPYLNQDLRITDLVDVFHVNRTYISSFINVEYNMNFASYINHYRMEEYRRLAGLPELVLRSKQELVEMAGFNSYRSFLRIKKLLS